MIANVPYYITNGQIHRDLKIPDITKEVKAITTKYSIRIRNHPNELANRQMSFSSRFNGLN